MSSRNGGDMLRECLRNLEAQYRVPDMFYFIDDGSVDGTGDVLREFLRGRPGCLVVNQPHKHDVSGIHRDIFNGYEMLFSRGCNRVIHIGDDIMIPPGGLRDLLYFMRRDNMSYICGKVSEDGGFVDGYSVLHKTKWYQCRDLITDSYYRHSVLMRSSEMDSTKAIYNQCVAHEARPRGTHYDWRLWVRRGRTHRYVGHSVWFGLLKSAVTFRRWGARSAVGYLAGFVSQRTRPGPMDPIRNYVRGVEFR